VLPFSGVMGVPFILLPGLGADSGLFSEQKKFFGEQLLTLHWIAPEKNETLSEYCLRFSTVLMQNISQLGVKEFFLGGFSFGGMAALELASTLSLSHPGKVKGVLLISSGRTSKIIRRSFKFQASVGRKVPNTLLKMILEQQMLQQFVHTENLNAELTDRLKTMLNTLDIQFFKWSLGACAAWNPQERYLSPQLEFPIFEIQGENDPIIPFSTETGVITLRGAKHLIQYTHAQEVNQWLSSITQNG